MRRLLLAVLLAVSAASCSDGSDELVAQDVVSKIPWTAPEVSHYRLLQGDDIKGSGEFRIEESGNVLILSQDFEFPDQEVSDTVSVEANAQTLRPSAVERVIDGPEGKRECDAVYGEGAVIVEQKTEEDERTDELSVPEQHYDTWSDLFLWRTLDFVEDQELKYVGVLSCSLAKPDLLSIVLKIKKVEEVTVPAGTFQAWRLEIRSGGRTQKAWYADDDRRTLVRYDNGDLVFELESIN